MSYTPATNEASGHSFPDISSDSLRLRDALFTLQMLKRDLRIVTTAVFADKETREAVDSLVDNYLGDAIRSMWSWSELWSKRSAK